jgi:hypothetical protein
MERRRGRKKPNFMRAIDKRRLATLTSYALAIACAAWFIASLVIPALPIWESIFLYVIFVSVFYSHGIWPAIAIWALLPTTGFLLALTRIHRRCYRSAIAWLTVPAAGVLLFFFGLDASGFARFRVTKASYDQVIADARMGKCATEDRRRWNVAIDVIDCDDPVIVVFIWDGLGSLWHGVVYDATDEISKPPQDRSTAWKSRPIGDLLSCSGARMAYGDHYYRAGGSYGC